MKSHSLIIVGAGPLGLETALRATQSGFDVTVLDRGEVGAAVRRWGHVKLFTPFSMNSSDTGRKTVGSTIPADRLLTGAEFAKHYLERLAECEQLRGSVLSNHEVVAVSRATYGKSDRIGSPRRNEAPFRILVNTPAGQQVFESELLIDCTGFFSRHRHIGAGGIPCPGESLLPDHCYQIPNIATDGDRFANRHTLVIGSGYSAATSICLLAELAARAPETRVTWVTRSARNTPLVAVPDDPLPERVRLTDSANQLAANSTSCVEWIAGPQVQNISQSDDRYAIEMQFPVDDQSASNKGRVLQISADEVIANVGYRADTEPFEELQIHRCYATDGPIKLAAHLLGETSGDCLQQSAGGAALLKNPEPNFYILGAASYGRDNRFLIQTGLQQIEELFGLLKAEQAGVTE